MKTNTHLLVAMLALLTLVGCSTPAPIVKLSPSPADAKEYWKMGQHFVFATNKNVWFDCAFNCIDGDVAVYDVKITNESDTAVLVDPALFEQKVFQADTVVLAEDHANDPEEVLTRLKLNENLAASQAKNSTIFSIGSTILSAGAFLAVVASNQRAGDKFESLNNIVTTHNLVQAATVAANEDANIRRDQNWTRRKMLNEAFLRKTTLPRGTYIDGEVHFPYYKKANWYDLTFQVGNAKAYFYFKQELIKALPAPNK